MRKAYLAVLSAMATLFAAVGGKYVVVTPNVTGYTAPNSTASKQVTAGGQPRNGKSTNPTTGNSQGSGTEASTTGDSATAGTQEGTDQQDGDASGTEGDNPAAANNGNNAGNNGNDNGGNGGGANNGGGNGANNDGDNGNNAGGNNGGGNGANNGNNNDGQPSTDCKSYDGDSIWIGEIAHYGTAFVTIKVCGGAMTEAKGGVMMSNYEPQNTKACAALDQLAVQYYKTEVSRISYSGATLTSSAYQRSLQSALGQAGL